jgi:DNA polymerase I-like protein with 3'-5' exonuclease and polymerase domains
MDDDFSAADKIAIDIETKDPLLKTHGTGVYRKDGKLLGVSIAFGNKKEYYNFGHLDSKQDTDKNKKYIADILSSNIPKVGCNITYDLDYLVNGEGFKLNGKLIDIQFAESLLDEYSKNVSLDALSKKYLDNENKKSDILEEWLFNNFVAIKKNDDARAHLYKIPFDIVREYAIQDANITLEVYNKQKPLIEAENLDDTLQLENDLIPCMLQFRKQGVRINESQRKINADYLQEVIDDLYSTLKKELGEFNYNSSAQIAKIADKMGLVYETTDKGNPSINDNFFTRWCDKNETVKAIENLRKMDKCLNTFINGAFIEYQTNGRIHTSLHQLNSDEGGTRSRRFASSKPNLQNIPSKDNFLSQLTRGLFLPEEGHIWGCYDWSQIEYRFIAHYASGRGALEIRNEYNKNPKTDYHQFVMDLTGLDRKHAKNLNFGIAYCMGAESMSKKFGWDIGQASRYKELYLSKVPFISATQRNVRNVAENRGYIKTFLGGRRRLVDKNKSYIMFNALIQGSAAELMKKAMLDAYNSGVFNVLKPHLTVHDELDFSIPLTQEGIEACQELKNIMENCVKLKVPILTDNEYGNNWFELKKIDEINLEKIKGVYNDREKTSNN